MHRYSKVIPFVLFIGLSIFMLMPVNLRLLQATDFQSTEDIVPVLMMGDANGDGAVDAGDAIYIINYVFRNGPKPVTLNEVYWREFCLMQKTLDSNRVLLVRLMRVDSLLTDIVGGKVCLYQCDSLKK